jgi:hypothetical protein
LHRDFSSLCLVSKQIRQEARNIFFSKNKWVLHCSSSFNALDWVLKYWGQTALSNMTDLTIQIQAMKYRLVDFYQSLGKFADAVKDGHTLKILSVQWIEGGLPLQTAMPSGGNWSPQIALIDRQRSLERNSEGTRGRHNWEKRSGRSGPGWKGPSLHQSV